MKSQKPSQVSSAPNEAVTDDRLGFDNPEMPGPSGFSDAISRPCAGPIHSRGCSLGLRRNVSMHECSLQSCLTIQG
jgi:hypothetical protein